MFQFRFVPEFRWTKKMSTSMILRQKWYQTLFFFLIVWESYCFGIFCNYPCEPERRESGEECSWAKLNGSEIEWKARGFQAIANSTSLLCVFVNHKHFPYYISWYDVIWYDMIWYDMIWLSTFFGRPSKPWNPPYPFGEEGDSTIYQELTALYLVYYHGYLPVTTT